MATRGLSRTSTGAVVAKRSQAGCSPLGVLVSGRGGSIAVCVPGALLVTPGDGCGLVLAVLVPGLGVPAAGATAGRLAVAAPLGGRDTATAAELPVGPEAGPEDNQSTAATAPTAHRATTANTVQKR
jgi:hypothetical protein